MILPKPQGGLNVTSFEGRGYCSIHTQKFGGVP